VDYIYTNLIPAVRGRTFLDILPVHRIVCVEKRCSRLLSLSKERRFRVFWMRSVYESNLIKRNNFFKSSENYIMRTFTICNSHNTEKAINLRMIKCTGHVASIERKNTFLKNLKKDLERICVKLHLNSVSISGEEFWRRHLNESLMQATFASCKSCTEHIHIRPAWIKIMTDGHRRRDRNRTLRSLSPEHVTKLSAISLRPRNKWFPERTGSRCHLFE
jgi:hypothetical protein